MQKSSNITLLSLCIILLSLFWGVRAQNPCDSYDSGNWCYESGYVSCPSPTVRPCQTGLVCEQWGTGVVYCVRPDEVVAESSTTASSVATPATPAPTTKATSAPTTKPATPAPTTKPATPAPTTKPATPAPTTKATVAPTTKPATPAPTPKPTPKPTAAASTTGSTSTTTTTTSSSDWPNGPVKAIYIDDYCWASGFTFETLVDAGYNLIILAFWVDDVEWDCVIAWGEMTAAEQLATIDYAHANGARITASTGGSTDVPYAATTGTEYATVVANWVLENNLDGIDFDLENFGSQFTYGSLTTSECVTWVVDATNAARSILGDDAIITHAPQPPYFGTQFGWANGYGLVYEQAPTINYFLVQFYDNGPTTTYDTIFLNNTNGASVTQMVELGIPLTKIVVGKPVHTNDIGDDTEGYNTAAELNAIFAQAQSSLGWNTGVMGWQWTDVDSNTEWISTIYPSK